MTPHAPAYQFELETLILEAIQDQHIINSPLTPVELHRRLSEAFFSDDVRAVMDDMLRRGRIRVVFNTALSPEQGKYWTHGNRPAVRLEAGEVPR